MHPSPFAVAAGASLVATLIAVPLALVSPALFWIMVGVSTACLLYALAELLYLVRKIVRTDREFGF